MAINKYDIYRKKIERIQKIVDWREEERVGLHGCREIGALKRINIEDVKSKSNNLPDGIKILVFGGLVDRGYTTHDIDIFIDNKSRFSKDDIDKKMKSIFSENKGRLNRVYNLNKFEKDVFHLKNLIESFDKSNLDEKKLLCDKELNPIIEIHSHCSKGEKPEEFTECLATKVDKSIGSRVLECTNKKCILHDFKEKNKNY